MSTGAAFKGVHVKEATLQGAAAVHVAAVGMMKPCAPHQGLAETPGRCVRAAGW